MQLSSHQRGALFDLLQQQCKKLALPWMAGQTRSVGAVRACAPSDSVAWGWPVQLAEREDFQRLRANQQQSVHELQRLQAQLEAERREAADRSAPQLT